MICQYVVVLAAGKYNPFALDAFHSDKVLPVCNLNGRQTNPLEYAASA
jgi:hypothetical protein